jgi:hypothetical protein
MGNTFQDLPPLSEIANNTKRYIQRDIRVTYINTATFIDKCDNAATNTNNENVRSRMERRSAGKREYGGKGR